MNFRICKEENLYVGTVDLAWSSEVLFAVTRDDQDSCVDKLEEWFRAVWPRTPALQRIDEDWF